MDDNGDNTTGNPSTFLNLNRSGTGGDEDISPLEQDVLDEYARLARNMKTIAHIARCCTMAYALQVADLLAKHYLNTTLQTLASGPITLEMADGLRLLEQKVASVYTLMKASVYSIVLQQGQMDESDLGQDEGSVDE